MDKVLTRRLFLQHSCGLLSLAAAIRPAVGQVRGTQVLFDPTIFRHVPSPNHPESPARLEAVMEAVRALQRTGQVSIAAPRPANEDALRLVHTPQYVGLVRSEIAAGERNLSTGDTEISSGSWDAAMAAAGTVVSAVDAVLNGGARNAFCAVRPPGHHASQARGMGFCIFNNIAIGARHARQRYGVERILIVDWDVHHGNGTQQVFWNDGSVLFFDTHQHPWYPGTGLSSETGEGKASGLIVNRPLPAGAGRSEVLGVFRNVLLPAVVRFKPQLVMISAGFDSRIDDPLGRFTLRDEDFEELTTLVAEIADTHANGRLVSVLEGGYSHDGLSRAVRAHLQRLVGA